MSAIQEYFKLQFHLYILTSQHSLFQMSNKLPVKGLKNESKGKTTGCFLILEDFPQKIGMGFILKLENAEAEAIGTGRRGKMSTAGRIQLCLRLVSEQAWMERMTRSRSIMDDRCVEENNKGCSYLVFDTLKSLIFSDQGTESTKALIQKGRYGRNI